MTYDEAKQQVAEKHGAAQWVKPYAKTSQLCPS